MSRIVTSVSPSEAVAKSAQVSDMDSIAGAGRVNEVTGRPGKINLASAAAAQSDFSFGMSIDVSACV